MSQRTIIVGDIHGCYQELQQLLRKLDYRQNSDRLIFVGDVINRGPESLQVFQLMKKYQIESVLGNHEAHLIRFQIFGGPPHSWMPALKDEFGTFYPDLIKTILSWPNYLDIGEALIVHGGLVPGKEVSQCNTAELTSIRTWDGCGKTLQDRQNPPWFDFYTKEQLVVFGHWAELEGVVRPNVIGLDTGCVYGKRLTALVLPERQLVSVPALKVHCPF